ncbi:hypothetical protein CH378_05880 [Leptospira kmetyi]|uniref:Uncharacterized protein n=1 Tax=Leptospira kmetyi TaxID=408139 RepID=A0ABX4NB89_9LEPT|nr:hypothetical protein CH378_05880 [Leptospira kmetyi]
MSYYDVTDNVTGAAFCGGGTFLSFLTVSIAKTLRFPASKRIKAFFKTDEWAFGLLLGITIGLYFYFS